ncbi:MAG: hypothetical protein HYZ00_10170 [Candidatus Hydrogenedentes bacterium]|nr:hypothetical protein [Candidatus Hydrogenedentota bacterium]
MKRGLFILLSLLCLTSLSCQSPPEGIANKVLADFGLKERPEGYVSGGDQVFQKLGEVGATEMKRLNLRERHGTIKYEGEGLRGQFYKEAKVYEEFHPLDVKPFTGGTGRERGYNGYIEYEGRLYQSARKATRVEAEAESTTIPVGDPVREVYRYEFGPTGVWNGAEGERAKP